MNEFEQMYREVILDHYKNPRGHGVLEHAAGHIVSNFLVSDRGELTDRQLGVLFVDP